MTLPAKIYTEKEVEKARQRSRMVGWVQGGGAVIVGSMVLRLLGWIPALLVIGLVAFVLYKLVSGSDEGAGEG
jgi:hypothetical protein